MRYLGLALYAEGRTDYYFLQPLLERLCVDICLREASESIEVTAVLGLDHPPASEQESREVRIREAARSALGQWSVLFVHADGAGDPVRARGEQIRLDRLRLLESFLALELELKGALRGLNFLR
jgi:hypothetical protein